MRKTLCARCAFCARCRRRVRAWDSGVSTVQSAAATAGAGVTGDSAWRSGADRRKRRKPAPADGSGTASDGCATGGIVGAMRTGAALITDGASRWLAGRLVRVIPGHKRLEALRRRVVPAVGEHAFEFRASFDRGRKRISGVELQRALKPAAQGGGSGCFSPRVFVATAVATTSPILAGYSSSRSVRPRISESATTPICVTSERWSKRGRPATRGSAMRSSRPVAFAREKQLLERGSEHVLDDHQSTVRRDDQTLGTQRAVRRIAGGLVQNRDGGNELTNQTERDVEVNRQPLFMRGVEQAPTGECPAWRRTGSSAPDRTRWIVRRRGCGRNRRGGTPRAA